MDMDKLFQRNTEILERHARAVDTMAKAVRHYPVTPVSFAREHVYVPMERARKAQKIVDIAFAVTLGLIGGLLLARWIL